MLKALSDSWWVFALRGALALLFGVGALSYPGLTVLVLIIFFGVYALIDGVAALVMGIGEKKWSGYALLFVIGIWALVKGVTEIVAAIQIRKEVEGEWALALSGVFSVLFGLFILVRPGAGALALVWLIAIYAFALGILQLMVGFKLRRVKKEMQSASAPAM